MRKTLAVVALTPALTGGTAGVALAAGSDSASAGTTVVAQEVPANSNDAVSDKSGLWGLLGLLGLGGLVKRKVPDHSSTGARR